MWMCARRSISNFQLNYLEWFCDLDVDWMDAWRSHAWHCRGSVAGFEGLLQCIPVFSMLAEALRHAEPTVQG